MALPSKLSKMKMPEKGKKKNPLGELREEAMGQDLDNDLEEGEPEEHQALVLGEEDAMEPGMGDEVPNDENGSLEAGDGHDLTEVSDDDLVAELKKRGLAEDLDNEESMESPSAASIAPMPRASR